LVVGLYTEYTATVVVVAVQEAMLAPQPVAVDRIPDVVLQLVTMNITRPLQTT
jgi:hypothetical protein